MLHDNNKKEVNGVDVKIDEDKWSYVAENDIGIIIDATDIDEINEKLVELGVKVDENDRKNASLRNLCG